MTTAAEEIVDRLAMRWSAPEWLSFRELHEGPGFHRGRADFVAVAGWDSGGQRMHVVEVKVNRGDWKRELADPDKSANWRKACHWFWVAAPPKVVQVEELLPGWGLLETAGDGLRAKRPAVPNETATGPTAEMWVMMLRAMHEKAKQAEHERTRFAEFAGKPVSVEALERLGEKWHARHCEQKVEDEVRVRLQKERGDRKAHWQWEQVERRWDKWIREVIGWKAETTIENAERVMHELTMAARWLKFTRETIAAVDRAAAGLPDAKERETA